MGVLIFLLGFMLCGFIAYGIFTYVVYKFMRGEDICGVKIDFTRPKKSYEYIPAKIPPTYSYYTPKYHEFDKSKTWESKNPVFISSEADGILDIFEEFLDKYEIKVPCDKDEEQDRINGGNPALYGTAYYDLSSDVETYLRDMVNAINERGWS